MDSILDDLGRIAAITPEGLPSGAADTTLTSIGAVYAVDSAARLVQVGVRGAVLWLPAMPGRYLASTGAGASATVGLARVLLDPMTSRPVLVLGPVTPRPPSILATVTASTATTVTVTWDGAALTLPAVTSTYTTGQRAWVDLDDWGAPFRVSGPSTAAADPTPTPPTPPGGGGAESVTVTISPQWTSGWRVRTSRWGGSDGPYDVFQGTGPGIGQVIGLATYGDQIVNLGLASITSARLRAYRLGGGDSAARSLVVQGSPHGSQPPGAPSSSGDTATLSPAVIGGWGEGDLPASIRDGLRTGAVKGLAAVGSAYSRWGGTPVAGSMALEITGTRT